MTVGYFEEAVEARAGCVALFELFKEVASSVSRGGSPRLASIWFGLGFVLLLVVVVVCWWWPRSGLLRLGAFGPLEPLLADPTINDILVNSHRSVYVERFGRLEKRERGLVNVGEGAFACFRADEVRRGFRMRQHLAWSSFGPDFDLGRFSGVKGEGGQNKGEKVAEHVVW